MKSEKTNNKDFGIIRSLFWPIHRHEIKKFLPLNLLMFFILFNYTVLRNMKDSLVITSSGPEIIPFLKAFVILPFSIVIVTCYAKLSNSLSQQKVFYIILGSFIGFYIVYTLFIYPNKQSLHMAPEKLQHLQNAYPNFQHLFSVIANWTSSLFYLFAELWGATVLGLMFWQFANEITNTQEATRFYAMFNLISHLALIVAGHVLQITCNIAGNCNSEDPWNIVLDSTIILISISSIIIFIIHYWMHKAVLTDPKHYNKPKDLPVVKEKKQQRSIIESFKEIMRSKYLVYIALLVISYGLVMNLTGIMWKKQVLLLYPTQIEYAGFTAQMFSYVGWSTIIITFLFKGLVTKIGWYKTSLITPIVIATTAIPFFIFMFFNKEMTFLHNLIPGGALALAVLLGAIQQILGKTFKYCVFDPTKEMAYIPLDKNLRQKGKAAIDVTGYSLAKASGGYIAGALLVITATNDIMVLSPYLAVIVLIVIFIWLNSIKKLNTLYQNKLK